LDWSEPTTWTFDPPDFSKFPLLKLAYEAQEAGGSATAVLNAADEIAVEAFLADRIPFLGIAETVGETLAKMRPRNPDSVGEILEIDRDARRVAASVIQTRWGQTITTEAALRA
jgi:1-deoxy-D-xylulose-5-phosphate reductoisomerase